MHCRSSLPILIAVSTLSFLTCGIALANNTQQVLAKLQQSDKALRQGTIIYNETLMSNGNQQATHNELYYAADGRTHFIPRRLKGKGQITETVFERNTGYLVVTDKILTEVIFSNDVYNASGVENFLYDVVSGPSFALGRGLTQLRNITLDTTGTHLQALAPNNTKIEALLDPNHGYVAKEIIRKERNIDGRGEHVISRWQLGGFTKFNEDTYIATRSTFIILSINKFQTLKNIVVLKAQFKTPNDRILAYDWHRPGLNICDFRLGGPARAYYKSENLPANITSTELLELTRKRTEERAKLREAVAEYYEAQKQQAAIRSITRFAGIILILITAVVVILKITKSIIDLVYPRVFFPYGNLDSMSCKPMLKSYSMK